jgi:hypothetical protein
LHRSFKVVRSLRALLAPEKRTTKNARRLRLSAAQHVAQATHRLTSLASDTARAATCAAQDTVKLRANRPRELVFQETNNGLNRLIGLILADSSLLHYLVYEFIHVEHLPFRGVEISACDARMRRFAHYSSYITFPCHTQEQCQKAARLPGLVCIS